MDLCSSQTVSPRERSTMVQENDRKSGINASNVQQNAPDDDRASHKKEDVDLPATYISGRIRLIGKLSAILFEFYEMQGDEDLLKALISLEELHLDQAHSYNTSDGPAISARLGVMLYAQYEMAYDLTALERSIKHLQAARGLVDLHHPDRTRIDLGLAEALIGRCRAFSDVQDAHAAQQILESSRPCLTTASDNVSWTLVYTHIVSDTFVRQFIKFTQDEIDAFLSKLAQISPASLTSIGVADYHLARSSLSLFIAHKGGENYKTAGGPDAAASALRYYPMYHRRHYTALALAQAWADFSFTVDAQRHDAEHAVDLCQEMIDSAGTSVYRQSEALYRWAGSAIETAVLDHDLDAMERCITALRQAATLCPPRNLLQRRLVSYTSGLLGMYFEHSGRIEALDEVISLRYTHYSLIIEGAFTAANVGESMLLRARTVDDHTAGVLLQSAVAMLEERKSHVGFATVPWERTAVDLQLITASRMQLQAGRKPSLDEDAIINLSRDTLARGTSGDPHRPGVVIALSQALLSQAHQGKSLSFIAEANTLIEQELASQSILLWSYRADLIAMTAYSRVLQSDITGEDSLLEQAWNIYEDTISNVRGSPHTLFMIALRWATAATERDCLKVAFKAYSYAQSLLPRVVFLGQDVVGRLEALRQVNGLASRSSALAFSLDDIPSGVQFLEQTRGILWNQALQSRAPDEDLPISLSERLAAINSETEKNNEQDWTAQRHKAEQLEQVLAEIRSTPGFESFLLPPTVQDLSSMFKERNGCAVMVVPSDDFCDVICLDGLLGGYQHLRIPAINRGKLLKMGHSLAFSCSSARASREARKVARMAPESPIDISENAISDILADLWVVLAKPIIDLLGLQTGKPYRRRIWWCPIGAFTSLPLHAAGIYEGPNQDNVGNYAISSYTPTLSALRRAFTQDSTPSPTSQTKVLLIAQSDHESLAPLPNATLEVEQVRDIVPPSSLVHIGTDEGSRVDAILQTLPDVAVLHLACHGHQDQSDPLNSGFDLLDGRLKLGQLMQVSTKNAQLAYLSACESAAVDETRPDEAVNLAATMLFVGFKSVIATMWAMDDVDGPFVAELVYRRIFQRGHLDLGAVPDALHDAVCELRGRGVHPSRWATYIHIGA